MSVMESKRPKKDKGKGGAGKKRTPSRGGSSRDNQGGFRAFDPLLLEALDTYAKTLDRSRNYVMNDLLEKALRQLGFWPWPKPTEESATPQE